MMDPMYCPIYKKILNSIPDSPVKHQIADSMCRQASKYNIPDTLSAQEIVAAINIKHKMAYDPRSNPERGDNSAPSSEPGNTGVKDSLPEPSKYETKQEYLKRLVDMGLSLAAATAAANEVFGPRDNPVSGSAKQAIISRLKKQYPNLSSASITDIVNETIRSQTRTANVKSTRKGVSELQANSRHVYAASVNNTEIPAHELINQFQAGKYLPLGVKSKSEHKIKSASSDKEGVDAYLAIQGKQDGRAYKDTSDKNIKSASNAWRLTGNLMDKRNNTNQIVREVQEAEKKNAGRIKQASTKPKSDKPAFLTITDYYKEGSEY